MNILFLEKGGPQCIVPRTDRRFEHIVRILKKKEGDSIAAGCSDGTIGLAHIGTISPEGLSLSYVPETQAPGLRPILLLMGFPRPIQAGRILKDLTSLGIAGIWFALSDLGEKSFAESTFFKEKEYGTYLVEGAEQAGNPRLPEIRSFWSIDRACAELDKDEEASGQHSSRLMFHPDPSSPTIAALSTLEPQVTLAIGSERGWTERERSLLAAHGFQVCRLGDRILKTETAALAAVSIVLSRLGFM
ncbi:MAG: RsmE family RNA methyltransferase [Rectinemataceae bacterium]